MWSITRCVGARIASNWWSQNVSICTSAPHGVSMFLLLWWRNQLIAALVNKRWVDKSTLVEVLSSDWELKSHVCVLCRPWYGVVLCDSCFSLQSHVDGRSSSAWTSRRPLWQRDRARGTSNQASNRWTNCRRVLSVTYSYKVSAWSRTYEAITFTLRDFAIGTNSSNDILSHKCRRESAGMCIPQESARSPRRTRTSQRKRRPEFVCHERLMTMWSSEPLPTKTRRILIRCTSLRERRKASSVLIVDHLISRGCFRGFCFSGTTCATTSSDSRAPIAMQAFHLGKTASSMCGRSISLYVVVHRRDI